VQPIDPSFLEWNNLHTNTNISELTSNTNEPTQNLNQLSINVIPSTQSFTDTASGISYTVNTVPSMPQDSLLEEIVKFNAYDFKG
jgi:hypothetical protein